jgi:hypothetical protein
VSEAEALAWTYALELPVVLLAALVWRRPLWRGLLAGLLASGLTHPFAWNIALALPEAQLAWGWYAIEAVVVLVEALVLGKVMTLGAVRALILSLLANSLSALAGWVLL